jgi:hypothetical protein
MAENLTSLLWEPQILHTHESAWSCNTSDHSFARWYFLISPLPISAYLFSCPQTTGLRAEILRGVLQLPVWFNPVQPSLQWCQQMNLHQFSSTYLPRSHFTSLCHSYSHRFSSMQFSVGRMVERAADNNSHYPCQFLVTHLAFITVSVITRLTSNIFK